MSEIEWSKYFDKINIPNENSRIYKDECMLSFDDAFCCGGLYVCLNRFFCFGQRYVKEYCKVTGNCLFLNIKKIKKESGEKKKVEKFAIGVEGGFGDEPVIETLYGLVCFDPINKVFPLPEPSLPTKISLAIDELIKRDSVTRQEDIAAFNLEEKLIESKFASDLKQIGAKNISMENVKCEKCDLTDCLWMNLSDGKILCGRRFWDGSGGNNHMMEHYQQTNYPLCVKVGTITPDGADVFSYPEEQMVVDPKLREHLAFFGIDQKKMKKTGKTMAELSMDANLKYEFNAISEEGKHLKSLSGPGYTGLTNLGNTCYLNSIMQVVYTIPEYITKYFDLEYKRCKSISFSEKSVSDLNLQLTKLGNGLLSGFYAKPENEGDKEDHFQQGIKPKSFKSLIGKNHSEFSTNRQQDALEYFKHFLDRLEEVDTCQVDPLSQIFSFGTEERRECGTTGAVKYAEGRNNVLEVEIPLNKSKNYLEYMAYREREAERERIYDAKMEEWKATTDRSNFPKPKKETEEAIRPSVSMIDCMELYGEVEIIDDYYSSAAKKKTFLKKSRRLTHFPDYLVVGVRRYYYENGSPKKLDVIIENVDELDISFLRGKGLQSDETVMPDDDDTVQEKHSFNDVDVQSIMEMGFSELHAKNALINTKHQGVQAAIEYLFSNQGNPILDAPIDQSKSETSSIVDSASLSQMTSMGLPENKCRLALQKCKGNIEQAINLVFSNGDELEQELNNPAPENTKSEKLIELKDGQEKYKLFGMVSHIGGSTITGHYIAHVKKDNQWIIFNDRKVALSENPPFGLAYLYFYKRM